MLYKVHRFFLERDSVVFRSMFSSPPGEQEMKGTSDDTAILLSEVTQSELDALLSFFYNSMYQPDVDISELKALLSISSRYVFEQIRQRAVEMLDNHDPPLSPAEQVALAFKYDIKQWLKPAYVTLGKRKQPISDEEAAEMGFEATVRLGRVRETLLKRHHGDLPVR
ncbi:uncharacterized protein LAESUDRAFT_650721 [Laetiporus sulphureus 93-53]|uniref:BTB domain-containing protein n=1 Tax=Laetiporus sulphureus 93-53 TaxID=1314785 RepID=A0A165ER35_9APHY|nr:uncharacterized protein LAESUDRAFT_650721 [Laetiporus sulphureus 93-53]KZT07589.1 hypothetical protein LAESUDRAFT_650721 [Laetiporus sulphureus 93-53]